MITIDDKKRDVIMVIMALLWAFVLYAAWAGAINKDSQLIYYGLLASVFIVACFYLMGAVTNEKMSVVILIFPVLFNLVVWIVAFTIA
jgi:4-amino-4-deoxy-L-arabinose transferase-like glycosyltransferase